MKKYTFLFLYCANLFGLMVFVGCGDECSGIKCQQDMEFPDYMEQRIPYKVNQVVRFANTNGDTIYLNCTSRAYSQQEVRPIERPESECCQSYMVENVSCELSNNVGDFLRIGTEDLAGYLIRISAKINNINYSNDGLYISDNNLLDSISLANKIFFNVATAEEYGEHEISMFLSLEGTQGIIGFKINGEEWVLVD